MTKRKKRYGKYICGQCKTVFDSLESARQHVHAKHDGGLVHIYEKMETIDLRHEDEPESYADRAVAAEIAIRSGEHTDDAWLVPHLTD